MTTGPHRGSREPSGQPDVHAGARRRGSPHPSRRPTAGREGPGVIMMPGPFSWSTGPLHRATPETATHHVHATGPNKRVSSAPNGVQPHWSLPFYVTHYGVLHTRGREQREHRRTPRTNPNARPSVFVPSQATESTPARQPRVYAARPRTGRRTVLSHGQIAARRANHPALAYRHRQLKAVDNSNSTYGRAPNTPPGASRAGDAHTTK